MKILVETARIVDSRLREVKTLRGCKLEAWITRSVLVTSDDRYNG